MNLYTASLIIHVAFLFKNSEGASSDDKNVAKERIKQMACIRNPNLSFCQKMKDSSGDFRVTEDDTDSEKLSEKAEEFPRQEEGFIRNKKVGEIQGFSLGVKNGDVGISQRKMSPPDAIQLQQLCAKFAPFAYQFCGKRGLQKEFVAKCAAYFRDCSRFIGQSDPLYSIANAFNSGVNINLGSFEVNGIPFYPINQEGSIGLSQLVNVPFGSWGGGYSDHLGVRDYWSQHQEAGANWYDGLYGYKSGWSVPLVQSLGVEGHGGTRVAVPLNSRDFGHVDVDTGYGVGGYYAHNDHTGVDWRRGNVNHQFGVAVPFAGVGVNTGTAVSFPSLDTFLAAG